VKRTSGLYNQRGHVYFQYITCHHHCHTPCISEIFTLCSQHSIVLIPNISFAEWIQFKINNKTNSVVLVHERTIPTGRPQLVGEVSANFCG
jgi:hypothetical protein